MPSTWSTIDALVHDIGELSADVHTAEHTLATDPRTRAARRGLDRATEAVSTAIDEASELAVARAASAIEDTRALIAQLGLDIRRTRNLVDAARKLVDNAEREKRRTDALRARFEARRPRR